MYYILFTYFIYFIYFIYLLVICFICFTLFIYLFCLFTLFIYFIFINFIVYFIYFIYLFCFVYLLYLFIYFIFINFIIYFIYFVCLFIYLFRPVQKISLFPVAKVKKLESVGKNFFLGLNFLATNILMCCRLHHVKYRQLNAWLLRWRHVLSSQVKFEVATTKLGY